MRFFEILLEYRRDKTAESIIGLITKKLETIKTDHGVSTETRNLASRIINHTNNRDRATNLPELLRLLVDSVLSSIESRDPTVNKQYTQWLARIWAKDIPAKIEDINRQQLLTAFDIGKRRRKIRSEHADINRYMSYDEFEKTMSLYPVDEFLNNDSKQEDKGRYDVGLSNSELRVIIPRDTAASCYYGRGTKWCTASTKTDNMFDSFNSEGTIYILIPKVPRYVGEKYQLHFPSDQFMNELDEPVDFEAILKRFPTLWIYLSKVEPSIIHLVAGDNQAQIYRIFDDRWYYIIADTGVYKMSPTTGLIKDIENKKVSLDELLRRVPTLAPSIKSIYPSANEKIARRAVYLLTRHNFLEYYEDYLNKMGRYSTTDLRNFENYYWSIEFEYYEEFANKVVKLIGGTGIDDATDAIIKVFNLDSVKVTPELKTAVETFIELKMKN